MSLKCVRKVEKPGPFNSFRASLMSIGFVLKYMSKPEVE
jgi:hypothetical protein